MIKISPNTQVVLGNRKIQKNLHDTLNKSLASRQSAVAEVENWEALRQHARSVKMYTLSRLGYYLEELERSVEEQGGHVIWAETGQEAVDFILDLMHQKGARKVVKSKSMMSEELHLNEAFTRAQVEAVETDLGEFIVQLAGEVPFHIVGPALHKSRKEIGQLFEKKLGTAPTDDVNEIANIARRLLRSHFLTTTVGITGVNFAVAESGTLAIVENEGNARLTVSSPQVHIALMGVEKVIPRVSDLAVFLKLLIRSATGQKITSYVNLINGPRREGELDGPEEFYLVLIDNGRSRILADHYLRQTLTCIRCGACQNICPVYQRIGGHAYASTYQGPIGAILTPQLSSTAAAPEHPFASSLCGACYEVCPVKIEIPHILLKLREKTQKEKDQVAAHLPLERIGMQLWAWMMSSPRRFELSGRLMRFFHKWLVVDGKIKMSLPPFHQWTLHRDLPVVPEHSFRELYRRKEGL